jgi:hypothetical protein
MSRLGLICTGACTTTKAIVPLKCLEKALEISPDHQLSRFFLGVLRERQGFETAAKAHFSALPDDCQVATFGLDSWSYVKSATDAKMRLFGETAEGLAIALDAARVVGLVLEFGVRYGTTIRQIAALAEQEVHGFDTFTGLPEAWHEHPAGTYSTAGKLPELSANVHLHAGLFAETLPLFLQTHQGAVRFINVDCDLYSSTQTVLAPLASQIVPGTVSPLMSTSAPSIGATTSSGRFKRPLPLMAGDTTTSRSACCPSKQSWLSGSRK